MKLLLHRFLCRYVTSHLADLNSQKLGSRGWARNPALKQLLKRITEKVFFFPEL
jgi:hypothetical protein